MNDTLKIIAVVVMILIVPVIMVSGYLHYYRLDQESTRRKNELMKEIEEAKARRRG